MRDLFWARADSAPPAQADTRGASVPQALQFVSSGETAHKLLQAAQHLGFEQNDLKHGVFGLQRTDALSHNDTTYVS